MTVQTISGPVRISTLMLTLRHHLNATHVYCRLVEIGVKKQTAQGWAIRWENNWLHKRLYA